MYISLKESLGIYTADQFYELLSTKDHTLPVSNHRAAVMQSRVYFFCVVFAILVPSWSVIDFVFLPTELWQQLLGIRIVTSISFGFIAWQASRAPRLSRARLLLAAMLAITPIFHLVTEYWIEGYQLTNTEQIIAELYALLPFVMVAGLTLFPLTLREFLFYAIPMLLVTVLSAYPQTTAEIPQAISTIWLFILILGVAMFASLNQLRYMLSQVSRASYDALTGMLTRRAGIEMLDLQFRLANMNEMPLSILYFDLDNFKAVNDTYGHEAGDKVLKTAAQQFSKAIRKCDSIIRWGGEEFIVVLPTADQEAATEVVRRVMASGIGNRPEGTPVTASIGVAEMLADNIKDWKAQVELADVRMYTAKTNGRARCTTVSGEEILWAEQSEKRTKAAKATTA
ncbi:MAG: GGDEF domain-containing protein [Chromatiales bacterium]|nr:GGDEF domain-containing protein [Chromatiales bacterium]